LAAGFVPVVAAVTALTATAATGQAQQAGTVSTGIPGSPIKHVIEIMVENHTFDNLFGSFPGADGIPANASFLNPSAYYDSAPDVSPVRATPNEGDVQGAINNSLVAEQMAMDYVPGKGYPMDHYTTFPQDGMSAITEFGPSFDPNEQYLATSFELADHNFQPVIAPPQPNVMTALNGTAHDWYYNNLDPGATHPWNSIFDELSTHNCTWKIHYALPTSILDGTIWEQVIPAGDTADLTDGDQFFTDLAAGGLPDFSGGGFWDHVAPSYASGYGTRTPMIIISRYARKGVSHQQTTNVSILKFMQTLWGLPPLTPLSAQQNTLMPAFGFTRAPLARPAPPDAPADTIGFHGSGGILTDIGTPGVNSSLTINVEAETGGLSLDSTVNGPVTLTLTPPPGVQVNTAP
jgi:phospholipase C